MTEETVANHFGLPVSRVSCFLLSRLNAMSFELKGMLGSGVTGVSHLDGHGKTLSYHLLTMQLTH
ncbi:AtuA-related protein [Brevibacterium limosum]